MQLIGIMSPEYPGKDDSKVSAYPKPPKRILQNVS
jgi:hypothetical protein